IKRSHFNRVGLVELKGRNRFAAFNVHHPAYLLTLRIECYVNVSLFEILAGRTAGRAIARAARFDPYWVYSGFGGLEIRRGGKSPRRAIYGP
ncbi:MAG: hypothetical protein ACK55Z_01575, partial [bacterium]